MPFTNPIISRFRSTCLLLGAIVLFPWHSKASWTYKGVCYDINWEDKTAWYGTPVAQKQISELTKLGINAISITPFAYMKDVNQPEIIFSINQDPEIKADVLYAKQRGLKVALKPHIWSDQFWDGSGHWHGTIGMKTQADWDAWFSSYEKMILHYAAAAEEWKVDLFVIGLEYEITTRLHGNEWNKIIREIKKVYKGPLTYAAHGLDEARDIKFWDSLDYIGINDYYPLSNKNDAAFHDLLKSWNQHAQDLHDFAKHHGKKILLTEIGYSSADGVAQKPYHWWPAHSKVDEKEQADCYEAMFQTLDKAPWLEGIFIWKFKTGVTPAEISRESSESYFVFQGKPAEKVIQTYFLNKHD